MRNSEETLDLITELVEDKGGEFVLWFEEGEKKFIAQISFDRLLGLFSGSNIICANAVNEMIDKVLESEVIKGAQQERP
jgi:hypothetical protein